MKSISKGDKIYLIMGQKTTCDSSAEWIEATYLSHPTSDKMNKLKATHKWDGINKFFIKELTITEE